MNNVRYAKLDATDEEVFEACRAASIHEQILGFSDGMVLGLADGCSQRLTRDRLSNTRGGKGYQALGRRTSACCDCAGDLEATFDCPPRRGDQCG
jgi:hypothetical protein